MKCFVDQRCASHVRHDKPHPPSSGIINKTVALMTEHHEAGCRRRRPLEHRICGIHQSLGASPFLIEATLKKLCVCYDIRRCSRLFELGEKISCQGWIKHCISVDVSLHVSRIETVLISDVGPPSVGVPKIE